MEQKSRMTAVLLAIFLGEFGIHWFYLGNNKRGVIYLLLCVGAFITFSVTFWVAAVLAIIDFIKFLKLSDAEFAQKYSVNVNNGTNQQQFNNYQQPMQQNMAYQAPQMNQPVVNNPMQDFFFCSSCGSKVKAGTRFCPQCGKEIGN